MSDFALEPLDGPVTRIELGAVAGLRGEHARPVNVYFVAGPAPALINAGHPLQADALVAALRACDSAPAEIERIICTSWEISVIGGATGFPRADLFVLSPDMQAPRDLELQIDTLRRQLLSLATELATTQKGFSLSAVEKQLARYYPRVTRDLSFIPLRNGHVVQAAELKLEVLAAPGPGPGHMALFAQQEGLLFSGDFAMSGLPDRLDNAQAYLVSLERLAELAAQRVLPNQGRTFLRGQLTMSRAAKFLNNFLTNVSAALVGAPTVLEFIERDLGRAVDEPLDQLLSYQVVATLFEELVRTRTLAAEGEGVARRYGVDVEDPRKELRRR